MQNTSSSQTMLFQICILVSVSVLLAGIFFLRSVTTSTTEAQADGIPHVITISSDLDFSQAGVDNPLQ